MEWVIQILAVLLSLLLAVIKSMHYMPNELSDFELSRKIKEGDTHAIAEQERRSLLPAYLVLQYTKEIVISVLVAVLLLNVNGGVWGAILVVIYFFAAYVIAARGWLRPVVAPFQHRWERHTKKIVATLTPFVRWMAPQHITPGAAGVASREEFKELIKNDTKLLSPQDKTRLLGAFDFGGLIVSDAMVPRDAIATVDTKETVGPVLLDRLHKQGHNVYVVVKKDIDHVKGLLYMSDLVPLDPDLKNVADATRSTVYFLPVDAPLESVLGAAITTGRQLFLVRNDAGETRGLITLADTLVKLNGQPVPKVAPPKM